MTQASKPRPLRNRFLAITAVISLLINGLLFNILATIYRNINGTDQLMTEITYLILAALSGFSLAVCAFVSGRSIFYKALYRQSKK